VRIAFSETGHRSGDGSGLGGNSVGMGREPARGRVGIRDGRAVAVTAGEAGRDDAGVSMSRSNGRGVECVRGRRFGVS
jgi:hypothetical protein